MWVFWWVSLGFFKWAFLKNLGGFSGREDKEAVQFQGLSHISRLVYYTLQ